MIFYVIRTDVLSDVDSQLLANALIRVKSVFVGGDRGMITTNHINTLCRNIIEMEENTKKLENLNMCDICFSDVESQLLASAVVKMKSFHVDVRSYLTTNQANTLCHHRHREGEPRT